LKKACLCGTFSENCLFMVDFVNNVRSFVNYAIFCELCDRMRFEVDCVKSHHCVISEGLTLLCLAVAHAFYQLVEYVHVSHDSLA